MYLSMADQSTNSIAIFGYAVTFSLGLIGHVCSLITFSQRDLRSTSTTWLFLGTIVSDTLFLLMSLYDFFLINLGVPQTSSDYVALCRFRTFVMNFAQTLSSWLLVFVAFDRLIRARLPQRSKQWCTKRNVIYVQIILVIGAIAFNCHVLLPEFTTRAGFTRFMCGVTRDVLSQYVVFYFYAWTTMAVCVNIILPSVFMFICLGLIHQHVLSAAKVRTTRQVQKQMLLLMLSKILLFIVCTLPYGISRMVLTYSIDPTKLEQEQNFILVTALFNILLNANYSLAFYVHCLTSSLFRLTFARTIKRWLCIGRQDPNAIEPAVIGSVSHQPQSRPINNH